MNILQVVPRIATESSGPSYSVPRLCDALAVEGADVALHVLEPVPKENRSFQVAVYPTLSLPFAYRLGWSPAMKKGLYDAAPGAAIIHNHSMWMLPNIYSHQAAKKAGCKYMFSPRGTLSEWALSRSMLRKAAVWRMGQKKALFGADCLHATSELELDEIRHMGISAPVAILPNGVDIPGENEIARPPGAEKTLLFLSRIHPKKGVDILLHAWQELQLLFPSWSLEIVGPLEGSFPRAMMALAANLGLNRVEFTGELRGQSKSTAYARADLFVLPTHSENFGLVVAEALAHGTPVVTTKGAPWGDVETYGCGWWIDTGQPALAEALAHAMSLQVEELMAMGRIGRKWMQQEYSWQSIGERMMTTYLWLLGKENRPDWVIE